MKPEAHLVSGPLWLHIPLFVKLYDLSYGFEIVLATSKLQKLQDICIILYR